MVSAVSEDSPNAVGQKRYRVEIPLVVSPIGLPGSTQVSSESGGGVGRPYADFITPSHAPQLVDRGTSR